MFEGTHYKSWSGLRKSMTGMLCDKLQGRVDYSLARYHKVHNSYGKAAILVDRSECVIFTWREMYQQDQDMGAEWDFEKGLLPKEKMLNRKWNEDKILSDNDFLTSATNYLQMAVKVALESDDYLIRIFAIMDRRVGRKRLDEIWNSGSWRDLPEWVRQFYRLRFHNSLLEKL